MQQSMMPCVFAWRFDDPNQKALAIVLEIAVNPLAQIMRCAGRARKKDPLPGKSDPPPKVPPLESALQALVGWVPGRLRQHGRFSTLTQYPDIKGTTS